MNRRNGMATRAELAAAWREYNNAYRADQEAPDRTATLPAVKEAWLKLRVLEPMLAA